MARTARIVIPNTAHHVVHRAHDGTPIFLSDDDYAYYLANLDECRSAFGCKIHAFCIMLDHVHLLVDPGDDPANLARLMKHVAARQTQRIKKSERHGGSQWESRFRSSPVADDLRLACARYIELNPVRACLAKQPERYRWSSAAPKVGRGSTSIDYDPAYLSLGSSEEERARNYKRYLHAPIPLDEWSTIRMAIQSADLTGSEDFKSFVASQFGVRPRRPRGRPRKRAWETTER